VVTGGARGIGRAHVEALAASGAAVAVADLDGDAARAACDEISGRLVPVVVDVTDERSVQSLMERVSGELGGIDILVCNAGGAKQIQPRRSFDEVSVALWDSVVALNLTSAWLGAKHAFNVMRDRGSGRIIFVSSASATTGEPSGIVPYIAAKGGVEALTRALARECGPYSITVNAVAPGFTPVAAVREMHGEARTAELEATMVAKQCRPVVGTAADVAAAVVFLASAAAAHITGQVIHVDGGWVL
jgi:3-oxoacyl-[acyl-carrier protein] reductase